MPTKATPLISGDWLSLNLQNSDVLVVDIRYYLGERSGEVAYATGHIPGAVFIDFDRDITGSSGRGRHPLPTRSQFQAAMRRIGAMQSSLIVVYDDAGGSIAARLWWLLRYFGHAASCVLDGGIESWTGPLSATVPILAEGDFTAQQPNTPMAISYEEVRALGPEYVLLDARAPERFVGALEPIDKKAGHIPGATSAFWRQNLDAAGRFLTATELRRRFEELGVSNGVSVVAYCGSGGTACHNIMALEVAGLSGARLYAGSWSDWISHDDAPVAVGNDDMAPGLRNRIP